MLEAILSAVATILSWPAIVFVMIGTLIGIVFGAIPGLGGTIAIALLIPMTFGMESVLAIILFSSTLGGVAFGGSISSILLNVPGTPPNAATLLDGYPMSRQGRAGEALGVAATASALGAIFGLVIFVLFLPVARGMILAFQPPEFFWLALFGLVAVAVATEGNLLKSIIAGGIGLMLSFIGYANTTGEYRYGFGTEYLWDGLNIIVVLIGLFAIAEVISMANKGGAIAETDKFVGYRSDVHKGAQEVIKRPSLLLRSATIGTIIGMIPGVGGTVANFISYFHAKHTSKEAETFGKGNLEGVLASEAANDAKDGGALIPTLTFGIPGSATMVVLLAGLQFHGIAPGRALLEEQVQVLFVVVVALLLSNLLTSLIGLSFSNHFAKLTGISVDILIAPILVICLVGSFALRNNIIDVSMTLGFGFLGYFMIAFGYSRVAVVLGLILGPIAERNFLLTLQIWDRDYTVFGTRPISLVMVGLIIISLLFPFLRTWWRDPRDLRDIFAKFVIRLRTIDSDHLDQAFTFLLLVFISVLVFNTLQYSNRGQLFPLLIGVPTLTLLLILAVIQWSPLLTEIVPPTVTADLGGMQNLFMDHDEAGHTATITRSQMAPRERSGAVWITLWILALFSIILLVGFLPGILAFLVLFYRVQAEQSWGRTFLFSLFIIIFIIVIFDVVLNTPFFTGTLGVDLSSLL